VVAEEVRHQRLVLFFGAGVSKAAGFNDFELLVREVERDFGMFPPAFVDLPTRVQRVAERRSAEELKARVKKRLQTSHYSMSLGLLASLRVREAITTDFDGLYELAAKRFYASTIVGDRTVLDVLPWERSTDGRPWLLKAHGDARRSGSLVFSADEYAPFRSVHGRGRGSGRVRCRPSSECRRHVVAPCQDSAHSLVLAEPGSKGPHFSSLWRTGVAGG
jgi:SIR2-like domain